MPAAVKRRKKSNRRARSKRDKPARTTAKQARGPTPKPVVIDVHAHLLVPEPMKRTYPHSQYAHAVAGGGGLPEPLFNPMTDLPLRLPPFAATRVAIPVIT